MIQRAQSGTRRLHPTHHLLYAFVIGALLTSLGFILARLDPPPDAAARASGTLVIAGSETLRPLMSACAEAYMSRHPAVDVVVRGGGSAPGIASLLAGQIDLALSSRELTSAELNAPSNAGVLRPIPIAREGIALIAHRDVKVEALDTEQLAALLAGDITGWSALGSAGSGSVVVVGRAAGSGTAAVVQERVLGLRSISTTARLHESHEEVIKIVGSTPGAIGYADAHLARTHAGEVRIIPMRRRADSEAYMPEPEAIASGKYPLARTLYFVAIEPVAARLQALIEHCSGPEGRPLIESAGFMPVPREVLDAKS
jgi:phosphate transport system substrate-binding protein